MVAETTGTAQGGVDMHETNIRAIVTGAASGIGAATARRLAAQGWHVECLDRDIEGLERLVSELGGSAVSRPIDLVDSRQVKAYLESAVGTTVDRIAFCAGVCAPTPLGMLDLDEAERLVRSNLGATVRLLSGLIPSLIASPSPRVVAVSSIHSRFAERGSGIYAMTKAGLESLVRTAAVEYGSEGVLVNAVAPGFVDTPMAILPDGVPEHDTEEFKEIYLKHGRLPLGRSAQAEEVAAAIHFLLSDENTYITGHSLVIDGGLTAGF